MPLPEGGPIGVGAIYQELTGSAVESDALVSKCFNGEYAPINPNSQRQPDASTPYSLGSFHGYDQNGSGLTSFWYVDNSGIGSPCGLECETEAWHNGAGALPIVNDIVYTDSAGTFPMGPSFNGPRGMSETQSQPAYFYFIVEGKNPGRVLVIGSCEE